MACTVTIDTRTAEMCRQTGVLFVPAAQLCTPITRSRLKQLIDFDGVRYDELRAAQARVFVEFPTEAGLRPVAHLRALAARARAKAA